MRVLLNLLLLLTEASAEAQDGEYCAAGVHPPEFVFYVGNALGQPMTFQEMTEAAWPVKRFYPVYDMRSPAEPIHRIIVIFDDPVYLKKPLPTGVGPKKYGAFIGGETYLHSFDELQSQISDMLTHG